jgi:adenylate cyclase
MVLKSALGLLTSSYALGAGLSLGLTSLCWQFYTSQISGEEPSNPIVERLVELHRKSIDWRLIDRGERPGHPRVAILAIDDRSLGLIGRWPWPRTTMGQLVDRAVDDGAKLIAFDAIFPEKDLHPAFEKILAVQSLPSAKSDMALRSKLDVVVDSFRTDQKFASTIARRKENVILGNFFAHEVGRSAFRPWQLHCLTRAYAGSKASLALLKESRRIIALEDPNSSSAPPRALLDHINTLIEPSRLRVVAEFLSQPDRETQDLYSRLQTRLGDLHPRFTVDLIPELIVRWYYRRDSAESMQGLKWDDLAASLSAEFSARQELDLRDSLIAEDQSFCARFWVPEIDPFLNRDLFINDFKTTYVAGLIGEGKPPEVAEAAFLEIRPQLESEYESLAWRTVYEQFRQSEGTTFKDLSFEEALKIWTTDQPEQVLQKSLKWTINIPDLVESAVYNGYFNAFLDEDGKVRRQALFTLHGTDLVSSLAMKTLMVDKQKDALGQFRVVRSLGKRYRTLESLRLIDGESGRETLEIPISTAGFLQLNYSGRQKIFPHVSAADILSDSPTIRVDRRVLRPDGQWTDLDENSPDDRQQLFVDRKEFLKDRILFLGATAVAVYDLRVTPFEENYPGVETHATALSNLLTEYDRQTKKEIDPQVPGFLHESPRESNLMWALVLTLGLALTGLLGHLSPASGMIVTLAALGATYLVDRFVFFQNGVLVAVLWPLVTIVTVFISITSFRYFTEERKKRELKGTFEKYVSPSIVAEVLASPENVELGGRKMDLTVMFSDLRNFTTISERLPPRELSDLLNSYLTPMTELVFANKGTLDKYMGDAIMAFWGAPIPFEDHAQHACRTALQMMEKLKDLQAVYQARGLELDIGIGINSGDMSVGNMGSNIVRSYTVMGDAVNLASRLEGINKEYKTHIIVSEFTQDRIKDSFTTREVDRVRVKGKTKPVRIFELICEGPPKTQEAKDFYRLYSMGLENFHQRRFSEARDLFSQAATIRLDDALCDRYIDLAKEYLKSPPPPDWDGVTVMKTK